MRRDFFSLTNFENKNEELSGVGCHLLLKFFFFLLIFFTFLNNFIFPHTFYVVSKSTFIYWFILPFYWLFIAAKFRIQKHWEDFVWENFLEFLYYVLIKVYWMLRSLILRISNVLYESNEVCAHLKEDAVVSVYNSSRWMLYKSRRWPSLWLAALF